MALDTNTYGSVLGVAAHVKHLTNSGSTFDVATGPTLTEVESFLDQVSDVLNGWLARAGYVIPVTNANAVTVLGRYANLGAAGHCELSQRSAGYSAEDENRRENKFFDLFKLAEAYINSGALAALGVTIATDTAPPPLSGFRIGGRTRGGTALQPMFSRGMMGNQPAAEYQGAESDAVTE